MERIWIDNTSLHGAGRSLLGRANTQHDVGNLVSIGNLLMFADSITHGGFEADEVADTSVQFSELLIERGVPKALTRNRPVLGGEFFGICDQVARRVSASGSLAGIFRMRVDQVLLDMPRGASHDHSVLTKLILSDERALLEEKVHESAERMAGGAIEYIVANNHDLRMLLRDHINAGCHWDEEMSFQVSMYLRALINIELGGIEAETYFPSSTRGQILSRIDQSIVSMANEIVADEISGMHRHEIELPPTSIFLLEKSRADPKRLIDEALKFRERLSRSREVLARIRAGQSEFANNTRFQESNQLIEELRGQVREAFGIKVKRRLADCFSINFTLGIPTIRMSLTEFGDWLRTRELNKSVYGISDLAVTAARSRVGTAHYEELLNNAGVRS